MRPKITPKATILQRRGNTRLSVNECKLNMKKIGMNDEKIDLIEENLKAIISKVFDELKNE